MLQVKLCDSSDDVSDDVDSAGTWSHDDATADIYYTSPFDPHLYVLKTSIINVLTVLLNSGHYVNWTDTSYVNYSRV